MSFDFSSKGQCHDPFRSFLGHTTLMNELPNDLVLFVHSSADLDASWKAFHSPASRKVWRSYNSSSS
jgi:hypothetical protein